MKIELLEGKRDEALGMFLPLFQKKGIDMNVSKLKQFLLNKFVTEAGIHNLSQGSNFYLLGVARYYFSGELTSNSRLNALYPNFRDKFNNEICQRLDALVGVLRGMYIDSVGTKFEQPEDFGNLSLEALLRKYNKQINHALGLDIKEAPATPEEKVKVSNSYKSGRKYTYEILYSFDDAKKYKSYTEPGAWCITYGKQHYDNYIKLLKIHYVIFKMNGFENVPRKKGKNWTKQKPQDEYGNSLIAVLQSNTNGEPIYITSRWNHGSDSDKSRCEADHAYTKEEFFKVTGCNDAILQRAFEQWKAGVKERGQENENVPVNRRELYAQKLDIMRMFKYAQMMINGGADIRDYIKGGTIIRDGKSYKGTYLVYMLKDNEAYYTIMDRKKLFFDQYIVNTSWGSSLRDSTTDTYCLLHDNGRKFYYIFDLIHHQFVNLDGCYKFASVSSDLQWDRDTGVKYGVLAQSGNQVALFDFQSMRPVKSRNGSCWFESICDLDAYNKSNRDYRGRITIPSSLDRNNILRMVYDSSSGEEYLFDTTKGQFIQTINEDGFVISTWQRHTKDGFIKYVKGNEQHSDNNLIRYQRLSTNGWFNVGGYDTFKEIDWNESFVIGYKGYDEEMSHYIDGKNGQYLQINGTPIETYNVEMNMTSNWLAISISRTKDNWNFWQKCVMFNPISRTMYHDNISGWYFRVYGGDGPKVYYPNSNDQTYALPSPKEAAQQEQEAKNAVTDNFNDMISRMNK